MSSYEQLCLGVALVLPATALTIQQSICEWRIVGEIVFIIICGLTTSVGIVLILLTLGAK